MVWLRKRGYTVAVVERWNPHAKIRQDLFGFIDVMAFNGDEILAIQGTNPKDYAGHRAALIEDHTGRIRAWLESGGKLMLVAWRKLAKRNRTNPRQEWYPRFERITLEDLNEF